MSATKVLPLNELLTPLEASYLKVERIVSMEDFCERDLIISKGLAAGKYRHETIPLSFEPIQKIGKREKQFNVMVGPKQTAKTVSGIVAPLLYNWLELNQDICLGYPTDKLAKKNYRTKVLPSILENPYLSAKLPITGLGSKGGMADEIMTTDGAILYFLGAGGGDTPLSSVTAPVILLDEIDKMQEERASSKEGSPIDQMIARADAFQLDRLIVMVCTATTETGRIWKEYMNGTRGLPYFACPGCKSWILFEFDRYLFGEFFPEEKERATQLVYDDTSKSTAEKTARLECPCCEKKITDLERLAALRNPRWVYLGQTISKKGKVKGKPVDRRCNSWRWTQLHSPFTSLGFLAVDHLLTRESDIEKQGFQLSKMVLPWREDVQIKEFKRALLIARVKIGHYLLKQVPDGVEFIIMGADVQKRQIYWWASGCDRKRNKWLIEVGVINIIKASSDAEPSAEALEAAMDELYEISQEGWQRINNKGIVSPVLNAVDTGYHSKTLVPWLEKKGSRWLAIKGRGTTVRKQAKVTGTLEWAIQGLLEIRKQGDGTLLYFVYVDESKGMIQDSFLIEKGESGYHCLPSDLLDYYAFWTWHMIAEQREQTFTSKHGMRIVWKVMRRQNHELDIGGYIEAILEYYIRLLDYEDEARKNKKEKPERTKTNQGDGINRSY